MVIMMLSLASVLLTTPTTPPPRTHHHNMPRCILKVWGWWWSRAEGVVKHGKLAKTPVSHDRRLDGLLTLELPPQHTPQTTQRLQPCRTASWAGRRPIGGQCSGTWSRP